MEWWQEIGYLVDTLGWWQIALVLIASVLAGILIGLSIVYLFTRFVLKQPVPFSKVFYTLFRKKHEVSLPGNLARQYINIPSATTEVHETLKFPIPELLGEIEHNLKICTEFSGENVLPLQSDVWDASRDSAHLLPGNLREQLDKVYFDIRLLNHIVSSFTKLDSRNSVINGLYGKRIPTIAERLQRIKQDIETSALIEGVGRTEIVSDGATIRSRRDFSGHSEVL